MIGRYYSNKLRFQISPKVPPLASRGEKKCAPKIGDRVWIGKAIHSRPNTASARSSFELACSIPNRNGIGSLNVREAARQLNEFKPEIQVPDDD